MQSISDLQIERYFERIAAWARRRKIRTFMQAHGTIAAPIRAYQAAKYYPEGDSIWPLEPNAAKSWMSIRNRRIASSAAQLAGVSRVFGETYTWLKMPRFIVTLADMKEASDVAFMDDITHIKNHGFSSSPARCGHTTQLWATTSRMNYVMQAGYRVAPIAVYDGIHDRRAFSDILLAGSFARDSAVGIR